MEFIAKEHKEMFYLDGNLLYLYWSGDHSGLYKHQNVHLNWLCFIFLYKLYLDKIHKEKGKKITTGKTGLEHEISVSIEFIHFIKAGK